MCDVSERNPNVLFELGMRLAFDKPTVIIKDDITNNCFDIQGIKYIPYPRHLQIWDMEEFIDKLAEEIKSKHEAAKKNKGQGSFLSALGPIKVAKVETTEVESTELLRDQLSSLSSDIAEIKSIARLGEGSAFSSARPFGLSRNSGRSLDRCFNIGDDEYLDEALSRISALTGVESAEIDYSRGVNHPHIKAYYDGDISHSRRRFVSQRVSDIKQELKDRSGI